MTAWALLLLCAVFGLALFFIMAACFLSGEWSKFDEHITFPDPDEDLL